MAKKDSKNFWLTWLDECVGAGEKTLSKWMRKLKANDPKQWGEFKSTLDALYAELYERQAEGKLVISDLYRMRTYNKLCELIDGFSQPEAKIKALDEALKAVADKSIAEHPYIKPSKVWAYDSDKGKFGWVDDPTAKPKDRREAINMDIPYVDNAQPIITQQRLKYANEMYSQRIWKGDALIADRIKNEMTQMILVGKSPAKIARDLRKTWTDATVYQAKRIAVTEAARIHTQINVDTWRNIGLEKVELIIEDDACEICKDLKSEVDSKGGVDLAMSEGLVPIHPN